MDYPNLSFATRFATRRLSRALRPLLICVLLSIGLGCSAPSPQEPTAAGEAAVIQADDTSSTAPVPVADASTPPPLQAPPMSDPLPPVQVPDKGSDEAPAQVPARPTVQIDTSCARDADCVVKDVGNCCGYYPACVNVNSPTDPAAVQAQCAREGMMSVCGFPAISGCQCVAGKCQAATGTVDR